MHAAAGDDREARASKVRDWPLISSERGPDLLVCQARWDLLENPRNRVRLKRLVLETPAWVNVVALTPQRQLIAVRQYRFGTRSLTLEIPGGVVDAGEEHAAAAIRELREESGYAAQRWTYLGAVEANPAFQDNLCHHWLAHDVQRVHALDLDVGEDIEVLELSSEQLWAALRSGQMRHSLVLSALSRVFDLRALVEGSGT